MISVVHIVAHLGGGAGRILSAVALQAQADRQEYHSIITLEKTKNCHFEQMCRTNHIPVHIAYSKKAEKLLNEADIIQIDWWHHPLVSEFMARHLKKFSCRLIIWSHISGCTYPNIPADLVAFPDHFVFSTQFSYENQRWFDTEKVFANSSVIPSSAIGLSGISTKPTDIRSSGFTVGYIGFLGYSKIHPEFISFCESAAHLPGIQFEIIGDTAYGEQLIADAHKSSLLADKINFSGYSKDVNRQLKKFDVFGYPLNPEHTGTAENALLEAMAAKIPPVVLNQNSERYTVQDGQTGFLVNTVEDYGSAIAWLCHHPKEKRMMGEAASEYVNNELSLEATSHTFSQLYERLMSTPKTLKDGAQVLGDSPFEWFKSCYSGDLKNLFGNVLAETKGSVRQYCSYFPHDRPLCNLVEER